MATARIVALALCACVLTGCDAQEDEGEQRPQGTYSVDPTSRSTTASAPVSSGQATMQSGPAVAGPLPFELEILPGAQVARSTQVVGPNGSRIALISLVTDDEPADVARFYRAAAGEIGLSVEIDMEGENGSTLTAQGAGGRRLTVHAGPGRFDADGLPAGETGPEADDATPDPASVRDATGVQLFLVAGNRGGAGS